MASKTDLKYKIRDELIRTLSAEVDKLVQVTASTNSYRLSDDLKQENKHDTRSIEANYLADAQAVRLSQARLELRACEDFKFDLELGKDAVKLGSLVEVVQDKKITNYYLLNFGAGTKINFDKLLIQILSPTSAIGQELINMSVGDEIEVEINDQIKNLKILSIN